MRDQQQSARASYSQSNAAGGCAGADSRHHLGRLTGLWGYLTLLHIISGVCIAPMPFSLGSGYHSLVCPENSWLLRTRKIAGYGQFWFQWPVIFLMMQPEPSATSRWCNFMRVVMVPPGRSTPGGYRLQVFLQAWKPAAKVITHMRLGVFVGKRALGSSIHGQKPVFFIFLLREELNVCSFAAQCRQGSKPLRLHDRSLAVQGKQSKRHRPLVPEYHKIVTLPADQPQPADSKQLPPHFKGVGSTEEVEIEMDDHQKSMQEDHIADSVKYGVYHTPKQFLSRAQEAQHPMDSTNHLEEVAW